MAEPEPCPDGGRVRVDFGASHIQPGDLNLKRKYWFIQSQTPNIWLHAHAWEQGHLNDLVDSFCAMSKEDQRKQGYAASFFDVNGYRGVFMVSIQDEAKNNIKLDLEYTFQLVDEEWKNGGHTGAKIRRKCVWVELPKHSGAHHAAAPQTKPPRPGYTPDPNEFPPLPPAARPGRLPTVPEASLARIFV